MRKDMDRILVGRPRRGGNSPKGTGRGKDSQNLENLPTKESMKYRWRKGDLKELNENLAPFYRFLDKQVGRPWNNVYSEIREQINANSAVQLHILQHLDQHVELHVVLDEDGKPWKENGYSYRSYRVEGLYVCPKTGILKEQKHVRYRYNPRNPNYTIIDDKNYIRSEHGWFEVEVIQANRVWDRNPKWGTEKGQTYTVLSQDKFWDALHKKMMSITELSDFYGRDVRCVSKRPLNKKEIKSLGLNK